MTLFPIRSPFRTPETWPLLEQVCREVREYGCGLGGLERKLWRL